MTAQGSMTSLQLIFPLGRWSIRANHQVGGEGFSVYSNGLSAGKQECPPCGPPGRGDLGSRLQEIELLPEMTEVIGTVIQSACIEARVPGNSLAHLTMFGCQ